VPLQPDEEKLFPMPSRNPELQLANLDAERALLGSILLDNSALPTVQAAIDSGDFFSEAHRIIFKAMVHAAAENHVINTITLCEELNSHTGSREAFQFPCPEVDRAGGYAYIMALTDGVPIGTDVAVAEYVRIVKEKSQKRKAIQVAQGLADSLQEDPYTPAQEQIEQAKAKLVVLPKSEKKAVESSPYPILPEAAWYGYAADYKEAVKDTTEASDVFHFPCFMSVAGALVGRNVFYKSPDEIYPNLYVLLVGRSGGARKGSAMGLSRKLMRDVVPWMRPLFSIDSAQGIIAKMKGTQTVPSGDMPEMPLATVACLSEFEDVATKAARKGTSDIFTFLNQAYDAPEWLEDNRATNPIAVQNGLLVIQAGTQEDMIEHLDESHLIRGIGNRLTYWPGIKKPRNSRTPDPKAAIWSHLVKVLKDIREFWQKRGTTRLDWTPEAGEEWDRYYNSLDDMLKENPLIQTLREREHTNCIKMALIHAALDKAERISREHLRAALVAAEFQHRAIIALFETFGASRWVKDENRIIEIVKAAGPEGMRTRLVQKKFPRMGGEHFQRHMRWLTVPDGPLRTFEAGRKIYVVFND